jgi:hypothetical protein
MAIGRTVNEMRRDQEKLVEKPLETPPLPPKVPPTVDEAKIIARNKRVNLC